MRLMDLEPLDQAVRIGPELAQGGFMQVFEGVLLADGDAVVVKVPLHPPGPEKARLIREAQLVGAVRHRSLARLRGVFSHPVGELALVYDHIPGPTLRQTLARTTLTPADTLKILDEVASGLDALHQAGLVCRDVKPANLVVPADGPCVLVDFGLIRGGEEPTLTAEGMVLGTPAYMAPEGYRGQRLEAAADRYALAILAYEMLTGSPPFRGSFSELARQHLSDLPPTLANRADLPGTELDRLFRIALAKAPQDRPQTSQALVDQLRAAFSRASDAPEVTTVSTSGLALLPTRPDRTTQTHRPPKAARARLGLGLLMAPAIFFGARLLLSPAPPEPSLPLPPTTPPEALSWLDSETLRDELSDLDWNPDPFLWDEQVTRVEQVGRFRSWIRSRPAGETWPHPIIERCQEAGQAFRNVGMASPFEPYLEVRPRTEPLVPESRTNEHQHMYLVWTQQFPAPARGWAGTAIHHVSQLSRLHLQYKRALRASPTGPFPGDVFLPQAKYLWTMGGKILLSSFVSQAVQTSENRTLLAPWLRTGEDHFHRALLAAVRSFETEPEELPRLSALIRGMVRSHAAFGFGKLSRMQPEDILGLTPRNFAQRSLAAELTRLRTRVLRETDGSDPDLLIEEFEWQLQILQDWTPARELIGIRELSLAAERYHSLEKASGGTAAAAPLQRRIRESVPGLPPLARAAIESRRPAP